MLKQISYDKLNVANSPLKVLSRSSRSEHSTEEKINWKKFNAEITYMGSVKPNVK
jgi:hypothetical protein